MYPSSLTRNRPGSVLHGVDSDTLAKLDQASKACMQIASGEQPTTVRLGSVELVIVGGVFEPSGCYCLEGFRVVERASYADNLEPLPYTPHWQAVDRGARPRSYAGMLVGRKRPLVIIAPAYVFYDPVAETLRQTATESL